MGTESLQLWYLVIATTVLTGWWLAVRPRASYAGAGGTMSFMIVLMAVLLCVLAVSGQGGGSPVPAHTKAALTP